MNNFKKVLTVLSVVILALALAVGCSNGNNATQTKTGGNEEPAPAPETKTDDAKLKGEIIVAGSSTVYPITILAAEDFMDQHAGVNVSIASTGTGGGFKKWVVGETDINNASRPIKDSEKEEAAKLNIDPIELMVAYDGITVVINQDNDFVDYLTVDELKKIWEPNSTVNTWADVRDGWPAETIKLYGPGTDSGTFEYFTEEIVGEAKASRTDYQPSEDDNVLVQGVAGDRYSLGYFGYSYFVENQDKLKAVPIKTDGDVVVPSNDSIANGTYKPLSRPIFIYVSSSSYERPEVKAFTQFYMENVAKYAEEAGYTPLTEEKYQEERAKLN